MTPTQELELAKAKAIALRVVPHRGEAECFDLMGCTCNVHIIMQRIAARDAALIAIQERAQA